MQEETASQRLLRRQMMSDKSVTVADETEAETGADDGAVVRVPCMVYSRVVGYLRPVQFWGIGKKQEFEDRVDYKLPT